MLDKLRSSVGGWVAKVFIGLLVLSFAVWGISDIFTGRQGTTLAEVGDQQISAEEFQTAFQRQIALMSRRLGRQISAEQARSFGIDTQVFGQLVSEAAIDDQILRMNLAVPEQVIANEIVTNPLFQGPNGRFDRNRFEQLLNSNGLTEASFVQSERRNKLRNQVAGVVGDRMSVPTTLTKAIHDQQNEKRTIAYFKLAVNNVAGVGEPSESELRQYYEANKTRYVAPEYRELLLLRLSPESVSDNIHITEEALRDAYEQRAETFVEPEARQVEQIVFPTLEEAAEARQRIKSGAATFLDIARERGFSEQDVNLGKLTRSDIPDDVIADAVFELGEGEISKPISGSLSIVLLRVPSVDPEVRPGFQDVKDELRNALQLERAQEESLNIHDVVEDERAGGATLSEIAKRLDLTLVNVPAVDANGLDPNGEEVTNIPDKDAVLAQAFDTDVGVETDPINSRDEGFVWIDVEDITPSKIKPFETIKSEVVEDWKTNRRRELLSDKARELVNRIESGEPMESVASGVGAEVSRAAPLRRSDDSKIFSEEALEKVFSVPDGGLAFDVADDGASAQIMKVVDVQVPQFTADSKDVGALVDHLKRSMEDDLLQQYLNGLRNISGVSVNDPVWRVLRGETS